MRIKGTEICRSKIFLDCILLSNKVLGLFRVVYVQNTLKRLTSYAYFVRHHCPLFSLKH